MLHLLMLLLAVTAGLSGLVAASPIYGFPWKGVGQGRNVFRPAVTFTNAWPVGFGPSDQLEMHWTGGTGFYNLYRYSSHGLRGDVIEEVLFINTTRTSIVLHYIGCEPDLTVEYDIEQSWEPDATGMTFIMDDQSPVMESYGCGGL